MAIGACQTMASGLPEARAADSSLVPAGPDPRRRHRRQGDHGLNRRVQIELALDDELQDRRGDKGFGDAGGTDVGLRRESGAGVDVGIPGRESGYAGAVPDDGDATDQLVAGHELAQRVVDAGGGLRVRARAAQCDEENGTDDRDAH
jgi:hypothetical protein